MILTQIMQLILSTAKKMQRVGGETSHEFQKRGQEQTQEQSI